MIERERRFLDLVSRRKRTEKEDEKTLGQSVEEYAGQSFILKMVVAHFTGMQHFHSVQYIEGIELLHRQCYKRLRAIAVWRLNGVCGWTRSISEIIEVQFLLKKVDFNFSEAGLGHLHKAPR